MNPISTQNIVESAAEGSGLDWRGVGLHKSEVPGHDGGMSSEAVTTAPSDSGSAGTWHGLGLHQSDVLSLNKSGINSNSSGLPLLTRDPAAGSSVTQSHARSEASLAARRAPLSSASELTPVDEEQEEGLEGAGKGEVAGGGMQQDGQQAATASRCELRSVSL